MAKEKAKAKPIKLRIDMHDWETEDSLLLLRGWARDGLLDKEIAKKIGITPKTVCEWKKRSSLIRDALKKSGEMANREVEEMLFKRAMGFYVEEEITETRSTGDEEEVVMHRKLRKFIPPSETAMIYWLKNRFKEVYRDNPKSKKDEKEQEARIAKLQKEARDEERTNEIQITIKGGEDYAD